MALIAMHVPALSCSEQPTDSFALTYLRVVDCEFSPKTMGTFHAMNNSNPRNDAASVSRETRYVHCLYQRMESSVFAVFLLCFRKAAEKQVGLKSDFKERMS